MATAAIRSESDWLLASTRMIWAPGAMAWAHSTSSAVSTSQLSVPGPLGSVAGRRVGLAVLVEHRQERRRRPVLVVERRPAESVRPNWVSNASSDWKMLGLS